MENGIVYRGAMCRVSLGTAKLTRQETANCSAGIIIVVRERGRKTRCGWIHWMGRIQLENKQPERVAR